MPHWILLKSVMRNKFLFWNSLNRSIMTSSLFKEAQLFSLSVLLFDFIICLAVLRETGMFVSSLSAPFLARVSALSLSGMSQWLRIH